ncbi:hypothetical protein J6590_076529 [Homalodisca vitripennis]|nr:hypothetical protein J6590_076529 [Homalodisca vitripennis]
MTWSGNGHSLIKVDSHSIPSTTCPTLDASDCCGMIAVSPTPHGFTLDVPILKWERRQGRRCNDRKSEFHVPKWAKHKLKHSNWAKKA